MFVIALLLAILCLSVLFFLLFKVFESALSRYEQQFKGMATRDLSDVFLFLDPVQLWTASLCIALGGMLIIWVFSQQLIVALVLGLILFVLPPFFIRHMKKQRLALFNAQLPLMLTSLVSALRAGAGVQTALKTVVQESPAPLSQEFGLVLHQQRLGVSFDDALINLSQRVPSESTRLMVAALRIAAQAGGNLAEALERIADTIRMIKTIEGKIDALTSQARLQGRVLALIPVILFLFFYASADPIERDIMYFGSTEGIVFFAVVIGLELLGILFIRQIMRIDI